LIAQVKDLARAYSHMEDASGPRVELVFPFAYSSSGEAGGRDGFTTALEKNLLECTTRQLRIPATDLLGVR
jgi:hypothetical protein